MDKTKPINEELTQKELDMIRDIIRNELAEVFFDLYRKRNVWNK